MKRILRWCWLLGIVAAPIATFGVGEKWAKPQQEVADVFIAWTEAILAGDVDRELALMSPTVSVWNYMEPAPMDRAAYRQSSLDFARQYKVTEAMLTPTLIQVDRRNAIAHGRYSETVQDAAGAKMTYKGPWTASLIREGNKWLVLGLSWCEDRPAIDEVVMREQVLKASAAFKAACEGSDVTARLAACADVPEFRFIDNVGRAHDYAELQQWAEATTDVPMFKITPAKSEVFALAPDRALELWTGAVDVMKKDAPTMRAEPFHVAFIWQRMGDAWKIVTRIDSSPPFAPATAMAKVPPAPTDVALAVTKAFNAHDVPAIVALYSEDAESVMSGMPDAIHGRSGKEAMLTRTFHAIPDLKLDFTLSATSGENVICSGTFGGTNTGTWITPEGEKPATGRRVSLPVTIVMTIDPAGLITSEHVYFDAEKYRQQLFGEAGG